MGSMGAQKGSKYGKGSGRHVESDVLASSASEVSGKGLGGAKGAAHTALICTGGGGGGGGFCGFACSAASDCWTSWSDFWAS